MNADSALLNHLPKGRTAALAAVPGEGRRTHDFAITVEAARQLGFPVSTNMPGTIYELMDLYQQTGEGRPPALYVPLRPAAPGRDTRQDAPTRPTK